MYEKINYFKTEFVKPYSQAPNLQHLAGDL